MRRASLRLDSLHLRLPGRDPAAARHLARVIAEGLATAPIAATAKSVGRLSLKAAARPGETSADLARRIVRQIAEALG